MVETFVQSNDDVVNFLKDQHNLIEDMFDEVLSASGDDARKTAFIDLRQLLAVQETAEELVFHPRARLALSDGEQIVEARLGEEHVAKERLQRMEGPSTGPATPSRARWAEPDVQGRSPQSALTRSPRQAATPATGVRRHRPPVLALVFCITGPAVTSAPPSRSSFRRVAPGRTRIRCRLRAGAAPRHRVRPRTRR
ncbi:MAG: Hemerythrin cation binding domain protein [Mycobacterium sp.]|jgi:hypothetical protein|nr:Hemerythrin cation binding domain protein [Mycobacterium sp.]MDT5068529.1 hypothetical protein [Mycobacterium sp.]